MHLADCTLVLPSNELGLINDDEDETDAVPLDSSQINEYHVEDIPDKTLKEYLGHYYDKVRKFAWQPIDYQPPPVIEDVRARNAFLDKAERRWKQYAK